LISGCFGIPEKSSCTYGGDKLRAMHEYLNKDKGKIDPQIGKGTTERGEVNDNFKRSVEAAIADSRTNGRRCVKSSSPLTARSAGPKWFVR
jgi:hypothetical protein